MILAEYLVVQFYYHASEKADDADIKAFAAKTLPTLQSHLEKAQEITKSMGSGGGEKAKKDTEEKK